jgi:hypothetical protein
VKTIHVHTTSADEAMAVLEAVGAERIYHFSYDGRTVTVCYRAE